MSNNFGKITTVEYTKHRSARDYGLLCVKSDLRSDFPVHQHDFYEFEIIASGRAKNSVDGIEEGLSAGEFYCLTPSTIHKVARGSDDLNIYNISVFLPDASEDIRKVVEGMPLPCRGRLSDEALSRVCVLYDVLFSDIEKRTAGEKEKVSALALYILSELSDNITDRYTSPRNHHTNLHVQRAMRYVQENFTSEMRLCDAAKEVGVTECYLSYIFSSLIGSTFGDYLSLVRINHAKKLLSTTDMPITEIAFSCGFGSFSNFERVFKKNCGITPRAYRKSRN